MGISLPRLPPRQRRFVPGRSRLSTPVGKNGGHAGELVRPLSSAGTACGSADVALVDRRPRHVVDRGLAAQHPHSEADALANRHAAALRHGHLEVPREERPRLRAIDKAATCGRVERLEGSDEDSLVHQVQRHRASPGRVPGTFRGHQLPDLAVHDAAGRGAGGGREGRGRRRPLPRPGGGAPASAHRRHWPRAPPSPAGGREGHNQPGGGG
mmetsp:Transcript_57150/g.179426  ORF Transcript_57150/g.179426 Transcript_57150/m.179426 type:complete len:212 (-) Transcript_57150:40-675(-)